MSAARPRRSRVSELVAAGAALLAAVGIFAVQPRLAKDVHALHQRDDVFLLPPPAQLRALTFGYQAASTDLLWAKLVLEYGTHWQEKRAFPDITRYIDGLIALEPDHPTLYQFLDTMLVFTPVAATEDDARTARRYLERGTRERPYDGELWLHYGQFVAFLAPSFLKDEAEIEQWRTDGAQAIAHAVELGADAERALTASTILSKAGKRRATVEHLQRAYAMTDDPEARRQIVLKLQRLEAEGFESDSARAIGLVENEWHKAYPFLPRGMSLLVGPRRDPARCAGPQSDRVRECAPNWETFVRKER